MVGESLVAEESESRERRRHTNSGAKRSWSGNSNGTAELLLVGNH